MVLSISSAISASPSGASVSVVPVPGLVRLRRRIALKTRVASIPTPPSLRSSITDHVDYTSFCALAATNPDVFATFKPEPVYREVLEHVTCEQGRAASPACYTLVDLDECLSLQKRYLGQLHVANVRFVA